MRYLKLHQDCPPTSASGRCVADLDGVIEAFGGTSLLVICGEGERSLTACKARPGFRVELRKAESGKWHFQGHYDVAVLYRVGATLGREEFIYLISSLRDVHASLLLVVREEAIAQGCPGSCDLVQLGLRRYATYPAAQNDVPLETYGFCMKDYKMTPEWLNSRHWANPELWGTFRW